MTAKKLLSAAIAAVLLFGAVFSGVPVAVAAVEQEELFGFYDGVTFHGGKFIDTTGNVLGTLDSKYSFTGYYFGDGLFEIYDEAKELFGIADKTGKIIVTPAYDYIDYFIDGFSVVWSGDLLGLIDNKGAVILPVIYADIYIMDNGYFCVTDEDGMSGMADKAGKIVIPVIYRYFTVDTGEGLFSVQKNEGDKWGAINVTGATVIPFEYDDAFGFIDGLAVASKGGKYGVIDKTGAVIIPFTYDYMATFSEGLALVSRNGKVGVIDRTGLVVLPFEYDNASSCVDGMIPVMKDGKYGFADKSGKLVVPATYDTILPFTQGLAFVAKQSAPAFYGYIDKSGAKVIDLTKKFESGEILISSPFDGDYALTMRIALSGMVVGAIDKTGAVILPMEYSDLWIDWDEGYWKLEKGEKEGLFKDGKIVLPVEYDSIGYFYDGVSTVGRGDDYAFFTVAGTFLQVESGAKVWNDFWDGLGQIWKGGKIGFVDNTGKTVIPCQYLDVTYFEDGWATAYDADGNWVILRNPLYIPSSWATSDIAAALALGLVPADLQANYTAPATRAEFCALAVTLYEKVKGEITTLADFTDTDDINVRKMAGIGVVTGNGYGIFDPDGKITREGSAVLVYKLLDAMGVELPAAAPTFADSGKFSPWAIERVGQVQAAGIMSGVGENKFDPQGAFTREMSIITMKKLWDLLNG